MKITIDEDICKKYNLSLTDAVGLVFVNLTKNAFESINEFLQKSYIVKKEVDGEEQLRVLQQTGYDINAILMESEKDIPNTEELIEFAGKLRELFPKGMKTKNTMWRGNVRDIAYRLQKFFKLYGNKYSLNEIYDATKKYVESFNGDYTYMRTLMYFILKSHISDGIAENISDLANFLENDCVREDNDDWLLELR